MDRQRPARYGRAGARWARLLVGGRAKPGLRVFYGWDRIPDLGEPVAGGTAKLQKLAARWPNRPTDFSLLYLGTTASGQLASVEVDARSGLSFGRPVLLPFTLAAGRLSGATRAFDTLPDGRFVGPLAVGGAADLELARFREVRIVTNRFAELTRLVPPE